MLLLAKLTKQIMELNMKDFFNSNYDEDDYAEATDSHSQQINLPQINEIDSDTYIFSINVHAGSCYRAIIFGEGQENLKVDVVGQKLVIREKKTNFKKKHVYSKNPLIIITIPEGTELIRIKAKISAGSTTLVQLTMQELELNLLAGSTRLTNVVVKKRTKATLSAGSLKVTNCTLNINADLAAGSARIEQLRGINHITLSAGSLTLIEDTDMSYDLSSSVGTITYHGERQGHHFRHDVSGNDKLIVKSSVGSIKIK